MMNSGAMWSGPCAFPLFKWLTAACTSASVNDSVRDLSPVVQWQTTVVPAKTNHGIHTNIDTLNSVNGASNNSKGTSLGTDDHVRQVIYLLFIY